MAKRTTLIFLASFVLTICPGQNKRAPANLRQAISILESDCPDSIKALIKVTPDKDLKKLGYPWGGKYKTVFDWTNKESDSKIKKYLTDRGISAHQDIVIFTAFKNHLLGQRFKESTLLQQYQLIEKKWNNEDSARYATDSLRGVYIPKHLQDCFDQINSFWPDSTKLKVRQWSEDEFTSRAHLGFGMWMRNNWQLWGGSRLSKYFNEMGITHPDDMSGIILDSYHRYLNNKELKLEEQIQEYKDYWETAKADNLKLSREKFAEYEVGDTVVFRYNNGFATPEQEKKYDDDTCLAKGKVVAKDTERFQLVVLLLESCDRKGIIYSDNIETQTLNPKTKKWEKPKKRVITYMKIGQTKQFDYNDWDTL